MELNLIQNKANILLKGFYKDNFINRKLNRVGKEYDKKSTIQLQEFPDYYNKEIDNKLWEILNSDKENIKNYKKLLESLYKNGFKFNNPIKFIIDLLGGIKSKNIKINYFDILKSNHSNLDSFTFQFETNKFKHSRTIDFKNKILKKGLIDTVNVEEKEKGIGHKMFISLINFAKNNGFQSFKIHAGGDFNTKIDEKISARLNGYEHWGKLGFELDKKTEGMRRGETQLDSFKRYLKGSEYENCEGILELYSKPGGYDFWVKNGDSINMIFDFNNKKQLNILNKYNNDYIKKYGL